MDFSRIKYKRSESSEEVVITIWRKNIYQKDYVSQNVTADVAQNVAQSSTEKKTRRSLYFSFNDKAHHVKRDLLFLRDSSFRIYLVTSADRESWQITSHIPSILHFLLSDAFLLA